MFINWNLYHELFRFEFSETTPKLVSVVKMAEVLHSTFPSDFRDEDGFSYPCMYVYIYIHIIIIYYMCIHVLCVYIYIIHIYIWYIYIYTYIHAYTHTHIYICIYTCPIQISMYTSISVKLPGVPFSVSRLAKLSLSLCLRSLHRPGYCNALTAISLGIID